jgi:ABC-type uncharacterized transport system auxiliary subunit
MGMLLPQRPLTRNRLRFGIRWGVYSSKFSLVYIQPLVEFFSEPDRRQVLCGNPTICTTPWQLLQYCYDFETNMYNAANTAAITGMVGIDNQKFG